MTRVSNKRRRSSHKDAGPSYLKEAPMAPLLRTAADARRRAAPSLHVCLAHLDTSLMVLAADALFTSTFSGRAGQICGRHLYDLLHPSAARVVDRQFSRLADGALDRFTERVIGHRLDGVPFSADLTVTAARNPDGDSAPVSYLVAICPVEENAPSTRLQPPGRTPLSSLHARILEGIAGGASNIQLAARLHLSRQGIDYHVGRLLRQLRAPNRAALVARAHACGMLTPSTWPPRVPSDLVVDADTTVLS